MKAQAALIGTYGAVHLYAEAAIYLKITLIIHPGHAEHNNPLRLNKAFQNFGLAIFRVSFQNQGQGLDNFFDGLMKFRLAGVFCFNPIHQ